VDASTAQQVADLAQRRGLSWDRALVEFYQGGYEGKDEPDEDQPVRSEREKDAIIHHARVMGLTDWAGAKKSYRAHAARVRQYAAPEHQAAVAALGPRGRPMTAAVYADFLQEQGHPAGDHLRRSLAQSTGDALPASGPIRPLGFDRHGHDWMLRPTGGDRVHLSFGLPTAAGATFGSPRFGAFYSPPEAMDLAHSLAAGGHPEDAEVGRNLLHHLGPRTPPVPHPARFSRFDFGPYRPVRRYVRAKSCLCSGGHDCHCPDSPCRCRHGCTCGRVVKGARCIGGQCR
jgi:hypothetical protein